MSRFEEITGQQLRDAQQRTTTDEEAAQALEVSLLDYKELCHIYSEWTHEKREALRLNQQINKKKPDPEAIARALQLHGTLRKAAKAMGIAVGSFIYWANKYGIHKSQPRKPQ